MSTALMLRYADKLTAGITTGHDWPNTQDELDRLGAGRLLREAAAQIIAMSGRGGVFLALLREADGVLETVEPEDEHEAQLLAQLRRDIAQAVTPC